MKKGELKSQEVSLCDLTDLMIIACDIVEQIGVAHFIKLKLEEKGKETFPVNVICF